MSFANADLLSPQSTKGKKSLSESGGVLQVLAEKEAEVKKLKT